MKLSQSQLLDEVLKVYPTLPRGVVLQCYHALNVALRKALAEGHSVTLPTVGTLRVQKGAQRNGFNPKTKEKLVIPAQLRVKFNLDPSLKLPLL